MLLKYGWENGGHLLEQQADLLFIVLSHGHVFGAPYPILGKVQLAGRSDPPAGAEKLHIACNGFVFPKHCGILTRINFLWHFAMSALGTSYYVQSPVLTEQEDISPRYSSAAGVEQAMLTEYGGHESCPLQAKSSIFAGSWTPISANPPNAAAPTYIHHHYTSGDSDSMFQRSWALDPVSASLCLTGLPSTATHYEIKPEPLIRSAECTTLETHTPLLSDIGNDASLAEIPCETTSKVTKENRPAEERREIDGSKCCAFFHCIQVTVWTDI